jgi:hypothetical protein
MGFVSDVMGWCRGDEYIAIELAEIGHEDWNDEEGIANSRRTTWGGMLPSRSECHPERSRFFCGGLRDRYMDLGIEVLCDFSKRSNSRFGKLLSSPTMVEKSR